MRQLGIPFEEVLVPLDPTIERQMGFFAFSPTGRVPCLHVLPSASDPEQQETPLVVYDSLAIVEYLADAHPTLPVWPSLATPAARLFARCAAAEMHAGFSTLRREMSMSIGIRISLPPSARSAALTADLSRISSLWSEGLRRFGGPWLAGSVFGAVDAMFAPVALRLQTYGVDLEKEGFEGGKEAMTYARRLLDEVDGVREWVRDGLAETWRDPLHDDLCLLDGTRTLLEDHRAVARAGVGEEAAAGAE